MELGTGTVPLRIVRKLQALHDNADDDVAQALNNTPPPAVIQRMVQEI